MVPLCVIIHILYFYLSVSINSIILDVYIYHLYYFFNTSEAVYHLPRKNYLLFVTQYICRKKSFCRKQDTFAETKIGFEMIELSP